MRCRLAPTLVMAATCVLASMPHVNAQPTVSTAPCAASSTSDNNQPSGPEVSIAEVTFSGSLRMPISDQEQIAESVKHGASGTPFEDVTLEGVTEDGLERVRRGWQGHGYFKVQVTGEARILTSSSDSQVIALSVQVDEGSQYNLGGIAFKNNKAISNVDTLRGLFPIADGEIFNREQIGTGLENLSKAYNELGYINFTSVPDTKVDDENNLVSLDIDMDERKQFRISSFDVLGLDNPARTSLLKDSPVKPGQVFRKRDFDAFLEKHISLLNFHPDEAGHVAMRMNEHAGTIAITINAAPCVIR